MKETQTPPGYARQVLVVNLISPRFSEDDRRKSRVNITFSSSDAMRILPHNNDLIVIIVQHYNSNIKRVLIDPESSTDILFWDSF